MFILLKTFFSFLNKDQKKSIYFIYFLSLFNSILELASIASIFPIVFIILEGESIKIFDYVGIKKDSQLFFSLLVFIIFNLLKLIFILFYNYIKFKFLINFKTESKNYVFKKYFSLNYSDLIKIKSSKIISNLNRSQILSDSILNSFIEIFNDFMIFFSFLILFFIISDIQHILLSFSVVLPALFFGILFKKIIKKIGEKTNLLATEFGEFLFMCLKNIRIIILENKQINFFDRASKINYSTNKNQIVFQFLQSINRPLLEFFLLIIFCLLIYYIINEFTPSKAILIITFIVAVLTRLAPIANRILSNYQSLSFNNKMVLELLNDYEEIDKFSKIKEYSTNLNIEFNKCIKVQNVNFSYPNSEELILRNFNCEFEIGDIVKVSGKTGSGKTTFVEILMGLQNNYSGDILVDNINIRKNPKDWKDKINYIPQELHLLNDTIFNNVFFGEDENNFNKDKFKKLSVLTELDDVFSKFEKKENTIVGEKGIKLSGGENQRLNIARGLVKEGEILILDESTNAINKEIESKIINKIIKLNKFKLITFISHSTSLDVFCNKFIEIV